MFWGTDFQTCKPQIKLDIVIRLLGNIDPFRKQDLWFWRKIKQLSFALSTSDEAHDIQYSQIRHCFKKLSARNAVLKELFVDNFSS